MTFIQSMAGAGGIAVNSAAALEAIAPTQDGAGAIIYGSGDPAVDGIYSWDLSLTDWTRIGALPITFAELENVAGTANAITADVVGFAAPGELKWIVWTPLYTNTAGGGEVIDLGNGDEPITNGSGGDLAPGDLVGGVTTMAFKDAAGNWRQLVSSRTGAIFDHKGDYAGGTTYTEGQAVTGSDDAWYQLKVASATGDDPVSGGSGNWLKILEPPVASVADGSLTTAKYADASVTFSKLGSDVGAALIVDTVAAVKAIAVASVSPGDLVYWRGYDNATDNCGGLGVVVGSVAASALDGVIMNLTAGSYHVRRVNLGEGPIHTRWCGIKPNTSSSATFDPNSFGASNRTRWVNLVNYAKVNVLDIIASSINIARASIWVDDGIHDFAGGSIPLAESVSVFGSGSGSCCLRFNYTGAQVACDLYADGTYGAMVTLQGFSVEQFATPTDINNIGLKSIRIVRGLAARDVNIFGFGTNYYFYDMWEYELYNCIGQGAPYHNFLAEGNINSAVFVGCRFDDCAGDANVKLDASANDSAQLVKFVGGAIQRSDEKALMLLGIRTFDVDGVQFEGNNRNGNSAPDIWIAGDIKIKGRIYGYFTSTGRGGVTNSRAINIRSDVLAGSIFEVERCECADNSSWTDFIDIDPNVAIKLHHLNRNDIGTIANSIPANVLQY
ncbi:hypothetical protein [Roseibium aggregatum]|uniref:hypothetical protein n=1 Tax=Roseibium aggregatum TaxID=187304 RepID=UPI001E3346D4|nr:hypothetical protein [Roseibium aggregatum]